MPVKLQGQESLSFIIMKSWPLSAAGQAMGCCAAPAGTGAMSQSQAMPPWGNWKLTTAQPLPGSQHQPHEHLPAVGGWLGQSLQLHHPGVLFLSSWTAPSIIGKSPPPSMSSSWHITSNSCLQGAAAWQWAIHEIMSSHGFTHTCNGKDSWKRTQDVTSQKQQDSKTEWQSFNKISLQGSETTAHTGGIHCTCLSPKLHVAPTSY